MSQNHIFRLISNTVLQSPHTCKYLSQRRRFLSLNSPKYFIICDQHCSFPIFMPPFKVQIKQFLKLFYILVFINGSSTYSENRYTTNQSILFLYTRVFQNHPTEESFISIVLFRILTTCPYYHLILICMILLKDELCETHMYSFCITIYLTYI